MISPSRPCNGVLRPSLNTAIRFFSPGTSTSPMYLYGIGGSGGGGGGPDGTAGAGSAAGGGGAGGGGFGLNRNRLRSIGPGFVRSASSASRCTSVAGVDGDPPVARSVRLDACGAGPDVTAGPP